MNKNEYENNKDMLVVKPLFHGRIDIDSTENYEDCVNDDYDDLGKGVVGYLEDTIESMGFKSTHSDIDMDGKCFKDRWESANITWESKSGELIVGTFEHSYYMECGFDDCHSFHGTLHFDNLSHENAFKILDTVKDGCIDEELDVSGNTKKEKRLYSSYQYALMNIGQQFKIDFNKYKDHLSADEQKKVMNSFMDSLNDEMARHPHYVIKGTYFDKNGKTCFFEAKAEIEGYMVRSQSTEPDKVKINLKDQIKNKEKPKGLKKKFGFPFYPKHKDDDRDFDNCR